jgi:cytidyltransferase-like protein
MMQVGANVESYRVTPYVPIRINMGAPRTVLCHGVFDLLHLGHIRHLQEARAMGDRLVVSVTADPHVGKGVRRPHFSAEQRVEALKALECVDEAFIVGDGAQAIAKVQPTVFVKGPDYNLATIDAKEVAEANRCNALIAFTKGERWSSSRLINAEKFDDGVLSYLDAARQRGMLGAILRAFEAAESKRIAFVGETIIDEYRFVSALGKASKEFVLATVETGREEFVGGVVAASKHGEWPKAEYITAASSLRKTRFVDGDFNRKLFEVYDKKALDLHPVLRSEFDKRLVEEIKDFDVVVVTDFGHGLFGPGQRKVIESNAKFLAVNAQSNAGNHGFNPVTKWGRADFVCIDEPEARLATHNTEDSVNFVTCLLAADIKCDKFLITHGKQGSFHFDNYGPAETAPAPAFASSALDTMGAGDAVIAVTAPLIAAGLDLEAAALVGNVVGAIKVGILGHRKHVGRQEIVQTVESLLK